MSITITNIGDEWIIALKEEWFFASKNHFNDVLDFLSSKGVFSVNVSFHGANKYGIVLNNIYIKTNSTNVQSELAKILGYKMIFGDKKIVE